MHLLAVCKTYSGDKNGANPETPPGVEHKQLVLSRRKMQSTDKASLLSFISS